MKHYFRTLGPSTRASERQLSWALSLLIIVITMVYVGLSVAKQQRDLRTDLERRGQALARGIAAIGATTIVENVLVLQSAMTAKEQVQDVSSVVALDKDHMVVASDDPDVIGQTVTNTTLIEALEQKTEVVLDGVHVGRADTVIVIEPLFMDLENPTGRPRQKTWDDRLVARELVGWIKVELSLYEARQGAIVLFLEQLSFVGVLLLITLYVIRKTVRRLSQDLYASEVRLGLAQRIAKIGNWEWNPTTGTFLPSSEFCQLIGVKPEDFPRTFQGFLTSIVPGDRERVETMLRQLIADRNPCDLDYGLHVPTGRTYTIRLRADIVRDARDQCDIVLGTIQDISDRKRAEDEIHRLAYYDSLTDLPNRVLFKDRLMQAMAHAKRYQTTLAVLFLDVDRFKVINDTLGHTIGDLLLKAVSDRLTDCVRDSDSIGRSSDSKEPGQLARLGGDEFTVLLTGLRSPQDAAFVARRILDELAKPYVLDGREVFVTASLGIGIFPTDGTAVDVLLKNADAAMYYAKEQGRNNYQFYSSSMNALATERLELEGHLRKAVERGEVVVLYQPKLNLQTNRIVGAEALVRWMHPTRGLVSPAVFLPVAVETGLMREIDREVLSIACRENLVWQKTGCVPIRTSVNVSNSLFHASSLVGDIAEELKTAGLSPQYLELELTESITMHDAETSIAMLRELSALGVRLSMDDFGTGYSSLSYLRQFPLNQLKIDQSFIRSMEANPANALIIKAIIALGHSLNLTVLAEGVETESQLLFLREQCCDEVQGYLLGRPMSGADFLQVLIRDQAQAA